MARNKSNLFNLIQVKKPGRNSFDLTHDHKLSCQFGQLVPTLAMECIPGDKWTIGCESMVRMAPMLAPVMHRANVYMHYWFVPNRILWPGWEDFITGGEDTPAHPTLTISNGALQTNYTRLHNHMGIPVPLAGGNRSETVNPFPFAAYQCIYNEFYRDQNFVAEVPYELVNGTNTVVNSNNTVNGALNVLRKRAWEHDYLTSALPQPQANAAINIPLGDVVLKQDWIDGDSSLNTNVPGFTQFGGIVATDGPVYQNTTDVTPPPVIGLSIGATGSGGTTKLGNQVAYDPDGTLETSPTTINDLRTAFKLQEWLEKTLRSGKRYSESLISHFGVKSADARLQRPEYITGTASPIVISEVLNTTGDTGATDPLPQGNMAGHGIGITSGKYGSYYCSEHGWIIGIMSIMPKSAYQDGLERKWIKSTFTDYFWPEFAHLGEQPVYNREVYAFTGGGPDMGTWGYNPRYSEYKYAPNRVSGDFRDTLDFWTMSRKFAALPPLNQDFIEMDYEEVDRIFAVQTSDDALWCHVLHKLRASRLMPVFGTPSF